MKRVFLITLALCLLLSMAACGEPAATTSSNDPAPTTAPEVVPTATVAPTTVPDVPETVDLVVSYEVGQGMLLGNQALYGYRMDFTYEADCRSGTVVLDIDDEIVNGIFTCDENYNICYMEFYEEGALITFTASFDEAHRLLSARSYVVEEENADLRYDAEYAYDSQGRNTYSKRVMPDEMTYITETAYNEAGQILRQTTTNEYYMYDAWQSTTTVMIYAYDENGYLLSISYQDGDGQQQMVMPATYEIQGDEVHYTLTLEGEGTMRIVWNKDGKVILQEMYSGEELTNRIETVYDEQGRTSKLTQWLAYNDTTTVIAYAYTADGRLQEHKQTTNGQETVVVRTTFQTVELPE